MQQELNNNVLRARVQSAAKSRGTPGPSSKGNHEQETNNSIRKSPSYSQLYTKTKRNCQNPRLKSQGGISPHSFTNTNHGNGHHDTDVNLNLTNVFRNLKDARTASSRALQTGREYGSQLSGGNGIYEPVDGLQGEGTQRLQSSLFDELLSNSTNPDLRPAVLKVQDLCKHLEENRQELAGVLSSKGAGVNYAFDDEFELPKSDAPKQGPVSECFDGDDRSGNNVSYKSH